MNKTELQQQVNKLSRLANKRLRHIEEAGLEQASNAYRYVQRLERDKVNYTGRTSTGKIKFDTASDNKNKKSGACLYEKTYNSNSCDCGCLLYNKLFFSECQIRKFCK